MGNLSIGLINKRVENPVVAEVIENYIERELEQDLELPDRTSEQKFQEIKDYANEILCSDGWELYNEDKILVRYMRVKAS